MKRKESMSESEFAARLEGQGPTLPPVVKVVKDEKWLPCYFKPCADEPHAHECLRGYVNGDKTAFRVDGSDYRWQGKNVLEYTIDEGKNYRPFNSIEELFFHWTKKVLDPKLTLLTLNHYSGCLFRPDIWVRHTDTGTETLITAFSGNNKNLGKPCVYLMDMWLTIQEVFDNYTFLDGTPFGKEI